LGPSSKTPSPFVIGGARWIVGGGGAHIVGGGAHIVSDSGAHEEEEEGRPAPTPQRSSSLHSKHTQVCIPVLSRTMVRLSGISFEKICVKKSCQKKSAPRKM
jgi:hypothetical protein